MTLIVFQVITQTISSTLHWFGLCFGIRTWAGPNPRRWPWLVGTTVVSAAWLLAIMLLAANNFFGNDVLPPLGTFFCFRPHFAASSQPFPSIGSSGSRPSAFSAAYS